MNLSKKTSLGFEYQILGGSVSRHPEVHKYFCSWFSFSGALWMKIRQVCSFLDYQVIVRYRIRHQN